MRKRLRKKLGDFSPDWWTWLRKNDKRDSLEARFVTMPIYCSKVVTESMYSFYIKKKESQIIGRKFRSKKKAVRYSVSLGKQYHELRHAWNEAWRKEAEKETYVKYRFMY